MDKIDKRETNMLDIDERELPIDRSTIEAVKALRDLADRLEDGHHALCHVTVSEDFHFGEVNKTITVKSKAR